MVILHGAKERAAAATRGVERGGWSGEDGRGGRGGGGWGVKAAGDGGGRGFDTVRPAKSGLVDITNKPCVLANTSILLDFSTTTASTLCGVHWDNIHHLWDALYYQEVSFQTAENDQTPHSTYLWGGVGSHMIKRISLVKTTCTWQFSGHVSSVLVSFG